MNETLHAKKPCVSLINRVKYQITVRDGAKTSRPKHNVKLRQSTTLQNMNYKSEGSINMNYIQG